jgi:hypothetical protein
MLRGIAVGLISDAMTIVDGACQLGLACLGVDVDWFNTLFEFVIKSSEVILFAIAGMTLYGLRRKLYLARWPAKLMHKKRPPPKTKEAGATPLRTGLTDRRRLLIGNGRPCVRVALPRARAAGLCGQWATRRRARHIALGLRALCGS